MKTCMLDDPALGQERRETLAQLLADGATREAIAEVFGISADTVTDWRKRADVQQLQQKIIRERANNILSQTDSKILARLQSPEAKIGLRELLEIRRTFAGEKLDINMGADHGSAITELMEKLHDDPTLAAALGGALTPDGPGTDDRSSGT